MKATDQLTEVSEHQDLAALPLDELRRYRQLLRDEEDRVSYHRRVLFGRVDLLQKVLDNPHRTDQSWLLNARELAHALRDRHPGTQRAALVRIRHAEELTELPDTEGGGWSRDPDLHDPDDVQDVLAETRAVADRISGYRSQIHARMDEVIAELIARYRADRSAVLRLIDER
ncbi:RsiG family protein [Segeticoccus rhizosphaerae]|jgi:hypothetical protein|uniref:RsiG family protein n=1 Tax=Segeticoccus rhizosphaerae TaxID=1104777 RepID=UPI0010C0349D|nr:MULTISPECIES: hypothetical protein [Intrasporangiaceae]